MVKYGCLFAPLEEMSVFHEMLERLNGPCVVSAYGPEETQRAHIIASVVCRLERPALVVVSNEHAAQRMREDLHMLLDNQVRFLQARDINFLKTAAKSRDLNLQRLEVLGDCVNGKVKALVVTVDALRDRLMPRERFAERMLTVEPGKILEPDAMMEHLIRAGYEHVQTVEARGQCARRGGIVDIYPVGERNAIRVEFFDDEIDTVREFDVLTQRSIRNRDSAEIYPANEMLLTQEERSAAARALTVLTQGSEDMRSRRQKKLEEEFALKPLEEFLALTEVETTAKAKDKKNAAVRSEYRKKETNSFEPIINALENGLSFDGEETLIPALLKNETCLLDYLQDAFIVLEQPDALRESAEYRAMQLSELFMSALQCGQAVSVQKNLTFTWEETLAKLHQRSVLLTNPMMRTERDFRPQLLASFDARGTAGYASNIRELAGDLRRYAAEGWRIALLAGGRARAERLQGALREQEITAQLCEEAPEALVAGKPVILPMSFNRGFVYESIKLMLISESDIYGQSRKQMRPKVSTASKMDAFTELNVGDYVVHENHGIGQYMGTVRLTNSGTARDYLHIRYQGTDKLYVPTDQMDRVQKYIGSDGETPKLNTLSGGDWQRQKSKVKQSIQKIAGDLLKLYAEREATKGYAFDKDTPWQQQFEDDFPFEETPDQLAAIRDIKEDMESNRVMDRLLCGDVGYGKTEVALRAIFKAVMSGKQAALLAPTTILVQQHYATMINRFTAFPVRVESLSRFKTPTEQKKILKQLEEGEIDVIVGTHRLLGKDVAFKNLGLLVVDEEQRFGVTHKEAIKKMKKNIDVLTLTATPIPRTLHMSMVGIRDMSLLESPPEERYPVQTYVVEYSDGLLRDAILRELARGGQVYVLHNRVQTIDVMYQRLKKLVPEARIAVGHGQMREHALEDVMLDFYEGKVDVLLCTTIIESGLDVPRANTLIVCDADHFGLSQLYQIRGRVGRSNRLAYAYFTVSPNKVLTENADKRLETIRDFTEFGSGFRVAMRDLEIRGAGNLLGSEQSGFMAAVGYDMYVKMVEQTVKELRGDISMNDIETRVDIRLDAFLPMEYIASDHQRIEMYKKIAAVRSSEDKDDLIEELIDRFGDPGKPVLSLIEIAQLKACCSELGIDHVTTRNDTVVMRFSMSAKIELLRLLHAIAPEKRLKLKGGNPPMLEFFDFRKDTDMLVHEAAQAMEKVIREYRLAPSEDKK